MVDLGQVDFGQFAQIVDFVCVLCVSAVCVCLLCVCVCAVCVGPRFVCSPRPPALPRTAPPPDHTSAGPLPSAGDSVAPARSSDMVHVDNFAQLLRISDE